MNEEKLDLIIKKIKVAMYNHRKDMYDYEMLVTHELDYNEWKILIDYIEQLQHNWNELKKWLKEEEQEYRKDSYSGEYAWIIGTTVRVLNKIQSLDDGGHNE
jgi:hypothetical protein